MKTLKTLFLLILVSTGFARANAGPGTLGTAITNVTGAYLGIKNALVANNATEA